MSHRPTPARGWRAGSGVAGLLTATARAHPDAIFLEDRHGQTLSYAETEAMARRLATYLRDRGVGRGDRVAIHLQNRIELVVALFAAALLGAIHVVLNARLRPQGLAKILEQADVSVILVDETTLANLAEVPPDLPRLCVGEPVPAMDHWDEAVARDPYPGDWDGCDVDAACLVFTSGSTGAPRGVTLTHDNIRFVVGAIQERLGYRPDDTVGGFLPLAFDYGLYQIFLAARSGAKLYLGDPDQVGPRLPGILKSAGITVLPGVPSIYAALITLARRRPFELPRLRAITNTGERLPLSHIAEMRSLFPGLDVFVMYGLTECKRVSILLPSELESHPDSVGRPLAGTEVYAVDESGERLPPGSVGELVVRGRHVALGYWRAPAETAQRFRKRAPESAVELFTGDTGSVDAEGFVSFAARGDDLMKHRGTRISPLEIEIEACSVPGVVEASLLKRESDDTLHLFVTVSRESTTAATLLRALAETLEPAKVPEHVILLTEMPKSINGKIHRKSLAARVGD